MAKFADLRNVIRKLTEVHSQVSSDASAAILDEIQAQFDAGLDPYGDPWEDLEQSTLDKGRTPPPLTDTSAMRDGIEVRPMPGAGISITVPDPGVHHQYGTIRMVARPIYPNRGMPDTWQRAIEDAADAAFERAAGGLRE